MNISATHRACSATHPLSCLQPSISLGVAVRQPYDGGALPLSLVPVYCTASIKSEKSMPIPIGVYRSMHAPP